MVQRKGRRRQLGQRKGQGCLRPAGAVSTEENIVHSRGLD